MRLIVVFSLLLLSGCSAVGIGAQYVSGYYCSKPADERALVRHTVNHYIHPDKIDVTCADFDPGDYDAVQR